MKEQLLQLLKKAKKGLSVDTIYEKLEIEKEEEKIEILNILKELVLKYEVYLSPNNNYFLILKERKKEIYII